MSVFNVYCWLHCELCDGGAAGQRRANKPAAFGYRSNINPSADMRCTALAPAPALNAIGADWYHEHRHRYYPTNSPQLLKPRADLFNSIIHAVKLYTSHFERLLYNSYQLLFITILQMWEFVANERHATRCDAMRCDGDVCLTAYSSHTPYNYTTKNDQLSSRIYTQLHP